MQGGIGIKANIFFGKVEQDCFREFQFRARKPRTNFFNTPFSEIYTYDTVLEYILR